MKTAFIFVFLALLLSNFILASGGGFQKQIGVETGEPLSALAVNPPSYNAYDEGEVFSIQVAICNITTNEKLSSVKFNMSYDPSLLETISIEEGPFFATFPWQQSPPYTYFHVNEGAGSLEVAASIYHSDPEPQGYIFPNGNGSIANITFRVRGGIPGATVGCPLHLHSVAFYDINSQPITVGLVHDGQYYLTLDKRYIDVYTQYPEPYGGQRRMHDADTYAPQSLVIMYAYVTYNRWPIQNEPVKFEIHGPYNQIQNITLYRTAFTNSTGYATISFRIDWPCEYPETIAFGKWTVYGSTQLDGVNMTDKLDFEAGWLVKLTSITLNEDAYRQGRRMTINVDYVSISHQIRPVFFTMTIYDDAGYGLGSLTRCTTLQEGSSRIEVTCFQIPKWARAGIGTVYADAYTNKPSQCGVPYCPEISKTFTILAM